VSLAYFSAVQAMSAASLWVGALLLVALPVAEATVGLDVITTVALIAPEWAVLIAIVLTGLSVPAAQASAPTWCMKLSA
jgi:hypothetical protein